MKRLLVRLLLGLFLMPILGGCTGITFPPHIFKGRPYTLLAHDGEIGRDQLMNRLLVAKDKVKITGLEPNQVLSVLGQPQEIQVVEREVSEDWVYVYYKKYTPKAYSDEGLFMVRMYHDRVIDVVTDL